MKWNLLYNARSFISDQTYTYRMYGLEMDNLGTKETTNARKSRDNSDEDKLLETLKSFNVLMENWKPSKYCHKRYSNWWYSRILTQCREKGRDHNGRFC